MLVYFGDLTLIAILGQTEFDDTDVGRILHRIMDVVLTMAVVTASTFFLFELHLLGKMISY